MSQHDADRAASDAAALYVAADLVTPMAVRVAATLGLADQMADGPRTATALGEAVGADADALDRLLCHLVTVGVVRRDGDGYALTTRGELLRAGDPSRLRDHLDLDGAIGRADLAFVQLLHSVRTGEAGFPLQFGQEFWADHAEDTGLTHSHDAQMGRDVEAWAPAVVAALDWSRFETVTDVGGGNGTLLAALLTAHPTLRGTVFDRPVTAAQAHATLDAAGVGERAEVMGGSFFETVPAGADAYLLCAVLHDWDDESATEILRRVADAAGAHGRIVVVEKTGREGDVPSTVMNLRVLVYFGGRERNADDLVALAQRAGLERRALHRAGDLSVLELAR